jgi:type 1 glutamine amidotransferase
MRSLRLVLSALLALAATTTGLAAAGRAPADGPKRLLLVTHSGGFIHDSVGVAEDVLKEVGPKHGFTVTCWRLTNTEDPSANVADKGKRNAEQAREHYSTEFRKRTGKTVGPENMGRINKETLRNFDIVLFFTTGNPMTESETRDLVDWVKAGGAFAGTHCATDTLYGDAAYGNLIGAYFRGHPQIQQIKVHVEEPYHPAAAGFTDGMPFTDEMYVFRDAPYNRDKLHVILSIEKGSFNMGKNLVRADGDYAISWTHPEGKGRVFYTSLGHRREVWKDERYQKHLFGGLTWALGGK